MRLRRSSARRRGGEPTGGTASGVVRGRRRWGLVRFTFIGLYFLFLLLPMYWALITAFKPQEDILAQPPIWFPSDPTFSHFGSALNRLNGLTGIKNSLIVAFATTFLAVVIGAAAAYSMARFRTGGKHLAFWFLSQRLLPPVAVVLPIFLLYSRYSEEWLQVRLYDTRIGLVLLYTVFSLPWTRLEDWHDALPDLSRRGFTTVAMTLSPDAIPLEEAVAGLDRVALVLGGEGHGLSTRWQAGADRRAVVPMRAGIDSLNVAAACAVACYVLQRR